MPFLRPFRRTYVVCGATASRAFWVTDQTADEWDRLVRQAGHGQPRDYAGRLLRPYPAMDAPTHRPYAPDGIYVDHRDPAVEQYGYAQRHRLNRLSNGERQAVLQQIADDCRLRHWRDAYNLVRNVGRRETGEDGRDTAGELIWRRWNNRTWSPAALAQATAQATASGTRCIGVELEFNHPNGGVYGHTYPFHTRIATAARSAGLTFSEFWRHYGSIDSSTGRRRAAGWLGTGDSTVSGGEIISDILAGDEASLAEIRTMLGIIRDEGGVAAERQGVHVHHDARDFTLADKVRLVDNLQVLAPLLESYLPASRRSGRWCGRMDTWDWSSERSLVAAGRNGSGSHTQAFNFGHLFSGSPRVEFRSFGHSLNSAKLRCWIRVGQAIMTATKAGITFQPGANTASMLTVLRQHGLSVAASDRFADTVDRRATGRPVLAA